jgi:hypothetical protein
LHAVFRTYKAGCLVISGVTLDGDRANMTES